MNRLMDRISYFRREVMVAWAVVFVPLVLLVDEVYFWVLLLGIVALALLTQRVEERLTQQLTGLLNAGMPTADALERLGVYRPFFKTRMQRLAEDLRNGVPFHEVCKSDRRLFSPRFARLAETAETHNDLAGLAKVYMDYYDRERFTLSRAVETFNYPLFVMVVLLFSWYFLLAVIVPSFHELFDWGASPDTRPWATTAILAVSGFLSDWGWTVLLGLLLIALVKKMRTRRILFPRLHEQLDALLLAKATCRLMETGVQAPEAVVAAANISGIGAYRKAGRTVLDESANGTALPEVLKRRLALPEDYNAALAEGSLSGDVPGALHPLIDRLQEYFDTRVQVRFRAMESGLILVLAVLTLMLLLGIYLPFFKIGEGMLGL